jgi:hypothetical protein
MGKNYTGDNVTTLPNGAGYWVACMYLIAGNP